MTQNLLLVAVPLIPLFLALYICMASDAAAAIRAIPFAPVPALVAIVVIAPGSGLSLPWLLLDLKLLLDPLGVGFLAFTAVLWLFAGAQLAWSEARYSRLFYASFVASMAGNLGVLVAGDMAGFYFFFALMSFAAYGMIVEERSEQAFRAGRVYMWLVVIGEVALFAALAWIATERNWLGLPALLGGTLTTVPAVLIVLGFGIKAGLVPLHVSLPLVYASAPSPARMVLAGAMLNAGVIGWLRFIPFGVLPSSDLGALLIAIGLPPIFVMLLFWGLALSHRFVGPLERLENDVKRISEGDYSIRIAMRKDDDLKPVADSINRLIEKLEGTEKR